MANANIRRLTVDLETSFERYWCDGDPFRTAFLNALSMSFPAGEQLFIDAVRNGVKALSPEQRARFHDDVRIFIGQEATHRRIHGLFNGHLARQGYVNRWEGRILERMKRIEHLDPRHPLGITAANEHITAVFADYLLRHPEKLAGTDKRLATMWQWHAAEELEHRSTAFDLYVATGGSHRWRTRWMRTVTAYFIVDVMRQTASNLAHDGELFKLRTWRSGIVFLFGRDGLIRETFRPWRSYFHRGFHPSRPSNDLADRWLREHETAFEVVDRS